MVNSFRVALALLNAKYKRNPCYYAGMPIILLVLLLTVKNHLLPHTKKVVSQTEELVGDGTYLLLAWKPYLCINTDTASVSSLGERLEAMAQMF